MIRFTQLYPILDRTHLFITDNDINVLASTNASLGFEKYRQECSKANALAAEDTWLVKEISLIKGGTTSDPFISVVLTKES